MGKVGVSTYSLLLFPFRLYASTIDRKMISTVKTLVVDTSSSRTKFGGKISGIQRDVCIRRIFRPLGF